MMSNRTTLAARIAATAQVMGTTLSDDAMKMMVADLERWPVDEVAMALTRVRHECQGRLALANILERIPSYMASRPPTAEQAWEMALKERIWDEDATVVLPNAIMRSFPHALWAEGNKIAARMTFKDNYAIESVKPDAFETDVSLGFEETARRPAIESAVREGRLPKGHSAPLLEAPEADDEGERQKTADLIGETVAKMKREQRRTDLEQREPAPRYQPGEPLPSEPL